MNWRKTPMNPILENQRSNPEMRLIDMEPSGRGTIESWQKLRAFAYQKLEVSKLIHVLYT